MKLERNYFTEDKKRAEMVNQRIKQEHLLMTPEELADLEKRRQTGWHQILNKIETLHRQTRLLFNHEHYQTFIALVEKAQFVAECLLLDVMASFEKNELRGMIQFTTDYLILNEYCFAPVRNICLEILSAADTIYLETKDNLITVKLFYDIYDTVPRDTP